MGTPPAFRGFFRTLRNLHRCGCLQPIAEKWAETLHTLQTPAMTRGSGVMDPATVCMTLHLSSHGLPITGGMLRINLDALNVDTGRIPLFDYIDVQ